MIIQPQEHKLWAHPSLSVTLEDLDKIERRAHPSVGVGISIPKTNAPTVDGYQSLLGAISTTGMIDYFSASLGKIYGAGSNIQTWSDQSGNGNHQTQLTAGSQPFEEPTGGPNGMPCITGDGIADRLHNATVVYPDPNPGFCTIFAVMRWNSWANNDSAWGSNGSFGSGCGLFQFGISPDAMPYNGTVVTARAMTLGTWYRVCVEYTGIPATSNWDKGGSSYAAQNFGTNACLAGRSMFARATAAQFGSVSLCEYVGMSRALTSTEKTDANAVIDSNYGTGPTTA